MKIALILPGGVDRSGTERVIPVFLWLIERLARRHTVHVIALHQYPQACTYPLLGATVHNLGSGSRWPGLRSVQTFSQLLRILITHGPFDLLHAFWGAPTGLFAALAGKLLRVPTVVSLAGGELVALSEINYGMQLTWRGRQQLGWALRMATRITASTHYMAQLAIPYGVEMLLTPLGVDAAQFDNAQKTSTLAEQSPFRLLHVASLNLVKDQTTLLRAMRLVVDQQPNVHLDIIGEDTLNGAIQRLCAELGLPAYVTFHGFLPTAAVVPFYQQADLFVLPSRHDAAPVVVLEAAICGVPTVGTQVGYVADWALERALAVPVGDAPALAAGILQLMRDEQQRREMGLAAQAWARQHDADWTTAQFEALYAALLH